MSRIWVRVAQVLIGAGAVFDEIENVLLARNVIGRNSLTDRWVDAMQVPGALEALLVPGIVVLTILAIVRLRRGELGGVIVLRNSMTSGF